MRYQQSLLIGAMFIIAAEFTLTLNGVIIKFVSDDLPNEMIVFCRNLFGLMTFIPLFASQGKSFLSTNRLHLHLLRGIVGTFAMYCLFYVMANINLADAMTIKSTIPIIIPIVAFVWFKEKISLLTRMAIAIGFLGVFFILKPGGEFNWVMLIGLMSSTFASIAMVTIRKLSETEPAARTVFYFAMSGLAISSVPLIWAWKTPTTEEFLLLMGLGILSTLVQLLVTRGYASAPASQVGIFSYSSVVFGATIGWLFWDEIWDITSVIGAILITVAGFIVLRYRSSISTSAKP